MSHLSKAFMPNNNNIKLWKTPPESPDLDPIENLWHELKEYIRREVRPTRKEELIAEFWGSLSGEKCRKYIRHLQKVIPKVIDVWGAITGYYCHPFVIRSTS